MLDLLSKKGPGPDFREEKHNKTTTTKKLNQTQKQPTLVCFCKSLDDMSGLFLPALASIAAVIIGS